MTTTNSQIQAFLPEGFSPEAQQVIIAMVLESYSESSDLKKQFEADYLALVVCPRCEGEGCNYCDFDGVYDPNDKEPDGTN